MSFPFNVTQLRNQCKGKIKIPIYYKGKNHEMYLSHVKVQIAASKKDIYLVWVYGITEYPLMLATNTKLQFKDETRMEMKVRLTFACMNLKNWQILKQNGDFWKKGTHTNFLFWKQFG